MSGPPFFSFPLKSLAHAVRSTSLSVRTLSPEQLASEVAALRAMAADQPGDLAVTLMADIYDRESARRVAPDHQFDTELDAALDRLERQTTPEDRELVRSIGERLHRLGGENALRGARERMLAEQRSGRPELRASIIDRRWAGVGRGA